MRRIAVHRRLAEAQDAAVAEHPERDRFQVHAAIDLDREVQMRPAAGAAVAGQADRPAAPDPLAPLHQRAARLQVGVDGHGSVVVEDADQVRVAVPAGRWRPGYRSEEHTSELQSLMRSSYAVFCLIKKKSRTY